MDAAQRRADLIVAVEGRKVSHVWNGYGSTIFLELGNLTPSTLVRKDGSSGNPKGEITIGVHWGWRIESQKQIVCGSDSENAEIVLAISRLIDLSVRGIVFIGRLPELQVRFSNELYLTSFMTAEGDPEWEIMDHRGSELWAMTCEAGQIHMKECPVSTANRPLR